MTRAIESTGERMTPTQRNKRAIKHCHERIRHFLKKLKVLEDELTERKHQAEESAK